MPAFGADGLPLYLNLNLIVPVVSAVVVIVLAIVIICYLRGRNSPVKGMANNGGINLVVWNLFLMYQDCFLVFDETFIWPTS